MTEFRHVTCSVCDGERYIVTGRNIDNKMNDSQICPNCKGKGVLYVDVSEWSEKTRKRFEAKLRKKKDNGK